MPHQPNSLDELIDLVRSTKTERQLLPVGRHTKPRLCAVDGADQVSLVKLAGVSAYEPSEFTFSALAGTPISEIVEVLAEHNQYLPFDPMLASAGATLGGTVASGLSGPGRFRYGGIRDFLLGVKMVTGDGQLIAAGGKVVKNAAGFDIPKLVIGSLGRFGALYELTFKVFPRSPVSYTAQVACESHEQAVARITHAASSNWELDALDYRPGEQKLYIRLTGPPNSAEALMNRMVHSYNADAVVLDHQAAQEFWSNITEFRWTSSESILAKVPLTANRSIELIGQLEPIDDVNVHISSGAAVAWLSISSTRSMERVDQSLSQLELSGLVFRGVEADMWLGRRKGSLMDESIKRAFDPSDRLPSFQFPPFTKEIL